LKIPSSIFSEFELPDADILGHLLAGFIKTNQLPPANIILSIDPDLSFVKSFKDLDEALSQSPGFIGNVPLENTVSSLVKVSKAYQLFVTSQKIIISLKNFFQSQKFNVKVIVPQNTALLDHLPLDHKITKIMPFLKLLNFSATPPSVPSPQKNILTKIKNIKIPPFAPYLGVAAALLLIIIIAYPRVKHTFGPKTPPSPTPTTIQVTPTPVNTSPSAMNLQIAYYNPRITLTLNRLKTELTKLGYQNLYPENDRSINAIKTYIIFPPTLSQSQKDPIIKIISSLFIDVTVQESNNVSANNIQFKLGQIK
jgi:hypothetical protein